MARATFVKSARKDVPNSDIKKGDSYYWWKFRFGGKHVSKTPPRASQLLGSPFLSSVQAALEMIEDMDLNGSAEDSAAIIRDASQAIQEAGEQAQESLDNIPEGLQQGDTGQMLEQRASDAEQLSNDLEQIADDLDELVEPEKEEGESDEDFKDRIKDEVSQKIEEAQALSYDGE